METINPNPTPVTEHNTQTGRKINFSMIKIPAVLILGIIIGYFLGINYNFLGNQSALDSEAYETLGGSIRGVITSINNQGVTLDIDGKRKVYALDQQITIMDEKGSNSQFNSSEINSDTLPLNKTVTLSLKSINEVLKVTNITYDLEAQLTEAQTATSSGQETLDLANPNMALPSATPIPTPEAAISNEPQ